MESGALCVMMSLNERQPQLLVDNLGLPDPIGTQMLVPGNKYDSILAVYIPIISMHACMLVVSIYYRSVTHPCMHCISRGQVAATTLYPG